MGPKVMFVTVPVTLSRVAVRPALAAREPQGVGAAARGCAEGSAPLSDGTTRRGGPPGGTRRTAGGGGGVALEVETSPPRESTASGSVRGAHAPLRTARTLSSLSHHTRSQAACGARTRSAGRTAQRTPHGEATSQARGCAVRAAGTHPRGQRSRSVTSEPKARALV